MTKFGKHPDKDTIDLAAEAAMGALADGGVTMKDMGVLAAGNLMGEAAGIGQQLQKQIGQTGIPVYNVANACATGATALRTAIMAVKAGECDYRPGRRRREAGRRRPARRRRPPRATATLAAHGPLRRGRRRSTGASAPRPCPACSPRSAWSSAHQYGGTSFELFARISEKNHAHSTLNPLAAYQKRMTPRGDHERHHDRLPEHPADVLGQLRRRRRRGGRSATRSCRRCRSSSSAGRSRCRRRC